jgi:hypothetical protein
MRLTWVRVEFESSVSQVLQSICTGLSPDVAHDLVSRSMAPEDRKLVRMVRLHLSVHTSSDMRGERGEGRTRWILSESPRKPEREIKPASFLSLVIPASSEMTAPGNPSSVWFERYGMNPRAAIKQHLSPVVSMIQEYGMGSSP